MIKEICRKIITKKINNRFDKFFFKINLKAQDLLTYDNKIRKDLSVNDTKKLKRLENCIKRANNICNNKLKTINEIYS